MLGCIPCIVVTSLGYIAHSNKCSEDTSQKIDGYFAYSVINEDFVSHKTGYLNDRRQTTKKYLSD